MNEAIRKLCWTAGRLDFMTTLRPRHVVLVAQMITERWAFVLQKWASSKRRLCWRLRWKTLTRASARNFWMRRRARPQRWFIRRRQIKSLLRLIAPKIAIRDFFNTILAISATNKSPARYVRSRQHRSRSVPKMMSLGSRNLGFSMVQLDWNIYNAFLTSAASILSLFSGIQDKFPTLESDLQWRTKWSIKDLWLLAWVTFWVWWYAPKLSPMMWCWQLNQMWWATSG